MICGAAWFVAGLAVLWSLSLVVAWCWGSLSGQRDQIKSCEAAAHKRIGRR